MKYLEKHKILKVLYLKWKKGEDDTSSNYEVTEYGRSMSVIEIQKQTKLQTEIIEKICIVLVEGGFLKLMKPDINNKAHRYSINSSGKVAYIDELYRNKFWLYNFDFWKWIIPLCVALAGLLNSIFRWIEK